jgi:hypothetical protein
MARPHNQQNTHTGIVLQHSDDPGDYHDLMFNTKFALIIQVHAPSSPTALIFINHQPSSSNNRVTACTRIA